MDCKYLLIQFLICAVHLSTLVQSDTLAQDELDRSTVQETGCKFLTVKDGHSTRLSINSSLEHVRLVSAAEPDDQKKEFELHFSLRSDDAVEINLVSKEQYLLNPTNPIPDLKFEIGTGGKQFVHAELISKYQFGKQSRNETYRPLVIDKRRPDIISSDKYTKFRILISKYDVLLGYECNPLSIVGERNGNWYQYFSDIMHVEISTKSQNGAKILYDCPKNVGGCKCTSK